MNLRNVYLGLALLLASCAAAQTAQTTKDSAAPGEMPQFKTEARQVLVVATVWDNFDPKKNVALLTHLPPGEKKVFLPQPIHGLTVSDFHLLDNGVEQKINYFHEADFPFNDVSGQWFFETDIRDSARHGMWGTFNAGNSAVLLGRDTYVLGFVPAGSASGKCHVLKVQVPGHRAALNRDSYCLENAAPADPSTLEGTPLGKRMREFADSSARGSVKMAIQAYAFRSSGVFSLLRESADDVASGLPKDSYNYVVEVHDSKAPATVQIAIEFEFPASAFRRSRCGPERAIHVLGLVYKTTGGLVRQFADRDYEWSCMVGTPDGESSFSTWGMQSQSSMDVESIEGPKFDPTRFNTQIELPPGDYNIRLVMSDGVKNFGRAEVPLHIDPVDGKQLTLSDIVLNGTLRDSWWAMRDAEVVSPAPLVPAPLISKNIQVIPSADNTVRKHNDLSLYFEIYEPLLAVQNPTVDYHVKVTDSTGTVVMDSGAQSAAERITPGNVVIPIAMTLKTNEFKKGSYRLEVQATDSAGRQTEWKGGTFTVE